MTPTELLDLSTRLCEDLKAWTEEMARENKLEPEYPESLRDAYGVIERATLSATAAAAATTAAAPDQNVVSPEA